MYSVYLSTSQRENTKEIKHRWKKQEKANTKEKPVEQKESEKEDTRKQGEGGCSGLPLPLPPPGRIIFNPANRKLVATS